MDDGPAGVVDHLGPVLLLELLAVVAEEDFADGVGAADAVVVQHCHLQVHLPQHAWKSSVLTTKAIRRLRDPAPPRGRVHATQEKQF